MLTLGKSNTTQAKNYYKQENYYSQEEAQANSAWQGKGASGYQLSGAIVDLSAYDNIVNGLSPDGKTQLRQKQNHQDRKELAGTDLTFSAPKSVSIACLVGGDKRLEEAHRIAVNRTIDLIESRYVTTRINKQPVQSDNLIVAKWHHDTSRELDPHLHTHCLIMNCTQGPDGKWRSINNKAFYQHKMLLGQIYRNELALECRKLGYEIEPHPQELFEIKGYTREQIEGFSKRHEQIKDKLIEMGAELSTENKAWAWRKTRAKKNHEIRREEKLPYWQEEADLYGITHPVPVHGQVVTSISNEQNEQITQEIKLAVDAAIEHCSERQVAFTREDIEKFVTAEVKPFSVSQLESVIAQHPELIKTYDGQRYTTQTALATELTTIRLMQQGKGLCSAIANPETIDSYLADKKLTSGQRSAIALSATTSDQFIAWQGVAGAGKTYALNAVKEVTTALGQVAPEYIIKGFAPSAEAAKVLGEELGIEANTVARLLVSKQSEQPSPNQIWIVDEAGLLSAKNAHALLERATGEGARVILVGDTRQLSAIEAGNPFKSLQSAGITTAYLDESLRQKPPDLQKAVGLAANGQLGEALSHLHQLERIEEVADAEERIAKIAADYIKLPPKERQQTLIVAGTHKERCAITEQIRTALKEEGTLGYGVEVTQLRARQHLTAVQTRYTHNYNVGDVVVPIRKYKRLGLHKSQPYKVEALEGDKLHLSDLAGNQLVVDPMKFRKTLYQQEKSEIAVGDRLRWTRNDKELGRRNGQEFTVTGIDGQTATIELQGGKTDTIDLYQPLHLDHALVATTYSSQGKTANRVLISSTCDATVSQESVYVAISRAKYDLKIYAEDIDYLLEEAQESKAQETVLELLQPKAKVQVAAAPVRTVTSSVKQSVGVPATPKITFKKESSVSSIERPLKRQNQQAAKPTPNPTLKQQPPKQLEVFWQPNSDRSCPPHIEAEHWRELVEGSAIHPDIAALNFRSLQMGSIEQEHQAWEYLMYSHKLERTNTGQLATGMLKRYAHIEAGGWWCNSGANALSFSNLDIGNKPQEKIWGCYKPNEPRSNPDKPGKVIKYEHPPKTDLGIFLLDVPEYIAQKIYAKAGIDPSENERASGFWYCAWKYNLPIVITEGAKKAASLLSQGHVAIGLPGIYAGYRSKDEQGNPIKAHLHEELAAFATLGREITFCFDFETRLETKQNIEIAISRTGSLLRQQGAKVSVVSLSGPEKGVDDLIVAQSPQAFEQQLSAALPLQQWREANKQQRQIAFAPPQKLSIEQRKQRLNQSLSGQPPISNQNSNQLQEKTSDDSIKQQLNRERAADREHNHTDSAHQLDTDRRTIDSSEQLDTDRRTIASSEQRSFAGERQIDAERRAIENSVRTNFTRQQGTEDIQPAVEQYSLSDQANAGRLHRWVQESAGLIEIGQEELSLGQLLNDSQNLNQSQEQISDDIIEQRQSSNERATDGSVNQSHNLIDQENHPVGENQQPTYEQLWSSERTNPTPGSYPDREPERIESQSSELLKAISRYFELQTVEQLGADIAELNRSLADGWLRGQGATFLASSIDRQDSAIVDRAAGNESIEQRGGSDHQRVSGQLIEAIANHLSVEAVASRGVAQDLHNLCQDLQGNQSQLLSEAMRKLDAALPRKLSQASPEVAPSLVTPLQAARAISNYLTARTIQDAPLAQELLPLNGQLAELHGQRLTSAIHQLTEVIESVIATQTPKLRPDQGHQGEQSIKAIVHRTQYEEIASPLVQPLTELTQQLAVEQSQSSESLNLLDTVVSDYLAQTQAAVTALNQKATQQALLAASNRAEHETIASALALTVSPLIEELSQHRQQLAQGKAASESLNNLLDRLTTDRTLGAVAGYIERASVTQHENIPTALASLTTDLALEQANSLAAINQLDVLISSYLEQAKARKAQHEQQTITGVGSAVSKHVEQSAVEALPLAQALTDLTQQLKSNFEQTAVAINQLDIIISGYLEKIEPLLEEKQQRLTNTTIASISQQINLSAIGSTTAISACKQIGEDLSMLQTASNTQALKKVHAVIATHTKETVITLAQQLRDIPLDEVAIRLGLTQDKYDKHKWRGEGQIISINDQKFYDHANLKGGYGAIDLVMHVQAREFKEALGWLADSALELPPVPVRAPQPKVVERVERQPFQPPAPDESKWLAVRQYLTQKRQLPAALVDELYSQGKVYADAKQNAVFLRQDVNGNLTGASLRGTYNDSPFKGLSAGSHREGGCFSFVQGEGQLQRIVIAESAIDALSAAALTNQQRRTMFVSTDGAGSVPTAWLKQQQQQGVEIVAAHDSDRAGEAMAWRLAAELGTVTRATPTVGKDWNEHLLGIASQPDVSQWKLVAQAIGKPDAYLERIEAVVASGQPLSIEAVVAMRLDFNTYKQTASDLWQWYEAARDIGKSDAYLERIAEVAISFHHSKSPMPLTQQATATMQQDLLELEQLLQPNSLWEHHSQDTNPMRTDSVVAHTATKDNSSLQQERLNIRAVELSIRLLSEFAKQQNSEQVSWTGGWYTFTKVGSDIKIDCSQRQTTILELSDGNLQGSITQREVEKFAGVLEEIKTKEIVKQNEL